MSPSGETLIRNGGTRRYRGVLRQIELRIRALFPEINRANRAMFRLSDLSEDMRILSLNAELAAGRAGQKGAAVRALTQYTRGLVRRLVDINANASGLGSLYDAITDALRTLRHLRKLEEATVRVDSAEINATAHAALGGLERIRATQLAEMAGRISSINDGTTRLGKVVLVVDDVVAQAASIATNIAAEAVTAGAHEAEFKAVSETMTRYVEELRIMNDQAAKGVRGALEGCKALIEASATLTRHQPVPVLQLEARGARA